MVIGGNERRVYLLRHLDWNLVVAFSKIVFFLKIIFLLLISSPTMPIITNTLTFTTGWITEVKVLT